MASQSWIGTTNTWATNGNWSSGSAPTNGDSPYFDSTASGSVAGGDFTASNTLAALRVTSLFSKLFGDNGTPVKVGATLARFGEPSGSSTVGTGCKRINWDASNILTTMQVYATNDTSEDSGKEPLRVKGTNGGNKAYLYGGRTGFATDSPTDVATFNTISLMGTTAVANIASGVSLTTLTMDAGTANLNCALSAGFINGGTINTTGSGAITQLNIAGTADLRSSGTVSLITIYGGGNVTMMNDLVPKAVTLVKMYGGSTFSYDPNIVTIPSGGIQLIGCDFGDVKINWPAISSRAITIT